MYENYKFIRWETPISDLKSVSMSSLIDDGTLRITIEELLNTKRPRWEFRFDRAPAYQNIFEEYRIELWQTIRKVGNIKYGNTVIVPESPWISKLSEMETISIVNQNLTHYMIITEDDVIDVLSSNPPKIIEVAHAKFEDKIPGKSKILRDPEDRDEIQKMFKKLIEENK